MKQESSQISLMHQWARNSLRAFSGLPWLFFFITGTAGDLQERLVWWLGFNMKEKQTAQKSDMLLFHESEVWVGLSRSQSVLVLDFSQSCWGQRSLCYFSVVQFPLRDLSLMWAEEDRQEVTRQEKDAKNPPEHTEWILLHKQERRVFIIQSDSNLRLSARK